MILKNRKIVILIALLSFIVLSLFAFNTKLAVKKYIIETTKVDNAIRIVFIADLHSCSYGKGQEMLIKAINRQKPDLILLGGDIADDKLPHENTTAVLESITKLYPCYYVTGNHEFWSGEVDKIKELFRNYNVIVLEGSCEKIVLNDQEINICGIDDPEIGESKYINQIETSQNDIDSSLFTILLAHRPEYIDTYLKYDFDLILSGHAHGGQWRIPLILNGLYSPNQGIFPKYAWGIYAFDEKTFIVSRGLAKESTRVPRIFNRPELVVVDILPQ